MKKSIALITVLITCLIALPLLVAQEKPAAPAAAAEKKCSDCHAPAYDGFTKAHATADAIGAAKCKMCHSKLYTSWQAGKHAKVECENCHGMSGKAHAASKAPTDIKTCGDCHTHER